MNQYKTAAIFLFVSLVGCGIAYDRGFKNGRKNIGLTEFHFTVEDAATGKSLDRFYSFTLPGTDFTAVHRSGSVFSVAYAVSDSPVTITIGKDGYESQTFEVQPIRGAKGGGPLPLDLKVIKLEPIQ